MHWSSLAPAFSFRISSLRSFLILNLAEQDHIALPEDVLLVKTVEFLNFLLLHCKALADIPKVLTVCLYHILVKSLLGLFLLFLEVDNVAGLELFLLGEVVELKQLLEEQIVGLSYALEGLPFLDIDERNVVLGIDGT